MTEKTVSAVTDFVLRWAPRDQRREFIKDLRELIETAVTECTEHLEATEAK